MAALNLSTLNSSTVRSLCPSPSPKIHLTPFSFRSVFLSPTLPPLSAKPNNKKWPFSALSVVSSLKKLSESELIPIPTETEDLAGKFPSESGVYAIYNTNTDLQFIGISRNIAGSILAHRKAVPDLCSSIKIGVVEEPDRTALTTAWKSWLEEHIGSTGKVPPGNESGNNTWVRRREQKPDLRLTPGRHVQLSVPLEELIDKLVKENKVVVFIKGSRTAPQCGFSQRVVGILDQQRVDYESVDVLDAEFNSGLREALKKYSNWPTFPQVFVKGELIGGADILASMAEKGELSQLFH